MIFIECYKLDRTGKIKLKRFKYYIRNVVVWYIEEFDDLFNILETIYEFHSLYCLSYIFSIEEIFTVHWINNWPAQLSVCETSQVYCLRKNYPHIVLSFLYCTYIGFHVETKHFRSGLRTYSYVISNFYLPSHQCNILLTNEL